MRRGSTWGRPSGLPGRASACAPGAACLRRDPCLSSLEAGARDEGIEPRIAVEVAPDGLEPQVRETV
jgi:hypothetical protein